MANDDIKPTLERLKSQGEVAAYSLTESDRKTTVRVTIIGDQSEEVTKFLGRKDIVVEEARGQDEFFHFLGGELRPGTGIIRRVGGRPEGPGGTLTCFLSSRDGQELYFTAAAHVVTNFWKIAPPDADGGVYVSRKGFPATGSMHSLGELVYSSSRPRRLYTDPEDPEKKDPDLDIAIVKLQGKFDVRQRTTCYGHFGEWPDDPEDIKKGTVMKCGAEETHWTAAVVEVPKKTVVVYGPDNTVYELKDQVILKLLDEPLIKSSVQQSNSPVRQCGTAAERAQASARQGALPKELPDNPRGTPFAVSGDSGTMVVDRDSKRPVGMLIAGSILQGRYVMTPISAIWKYWKKLNLVLLRA